MDILEDTVDEKYYLSQEKVRRLLEDMEERKALLFEPDEKSLKIFRENRMKRLGLLKGNLNRREGFIFQTDAVLQ